MKKILVIGLVVLLFGVTGCNKKEVMECSRKATIQEGVSMNLKYTVRAKGGYVEYIESEEKVVSEDTDYLKNFKKQVESLYHPYEDIEYYDIDVSILGNTLVSKTSIDYSKIDTDQLLEIDSANSQLIKNGKIKLKTIKEYYANLGITCKMK